MVFFSATYLEFHFHHARCDSSNIFIAYYLHTPSVPAMHSTTLLDIPFSLLSLTATVSNLRVFFAAGSFSSFSLLVHSATVDAHTSGPASSEF